MNFNFTLTLALGGIIGSLLTIIAKALIEEKQKKNENKRLIQKFYFEKKLEACERAVNIWYTIKSKISTAIQAIKSGEELEEFSYSGVLETFQKIGESLSKLDQSLTEGGNTIALYFDLDELGNHQKEQAKNFFKELNVVADLVFEIKLYQDAYSKQTDPIMKEKIFQIIEGYLPTLKEKMLLLGKLFEPMEEYYNDLIKKISKDLQTNVS